MTTYTEEYATLPGLDILPPIIWRVHAGSVCGDVPFTPMTKKDAATIYQKARKFDRTGHTKGKHGGRIGVFALQLFHTMIFDFLNFKTGQLDPAFETICAAAGMGRSAAIANVNKLERLGLLSHVRRCSRVENEDGGYILKQETNAYHIENPSNWFGHAEKPPTPPPPLPHASEWGKAELPITTVDGALQANAPLSVLVEALEDEAAVVRPTLAKKPTWSERLQAREAQAAAGLAAALARLGRSLLQAKIPGN